MRWVQVSLCSFVLFLQDVCVEVLNIVETIYSFYCFRMCVRSFNRSINYHFRIYPQLLKSMFIDCTDRLREIAEEVWVIELRRCACEVCNEPWHDWIRTDIVERTTRDRVHEHEILEVRNGMVRPEFRDLIDVRVAGGTTVRVVG